MGGPGSGRWRGRQSGSRPHVEDCQAIGPGAVAQYLELDAAEVAQSKGYFTMEPEADGAVCILEPVATPGGFRWAWRCPRCDRRRKALYEVGGRVGCRECLRLAYRSQRRRRPRGG